MDLSFNILPVADETTVIVKLPVKTSPKKKVSYLPNILLSIVFVLSSLFIMSCTPDIDNPASTKLDDVNTNIGNVASTFKDTSNKIKVDATTGMNKTPTNDKPLLLSYWTDILTQVTRQEEANKNLSNSQVQLEEAKKENDALATKLATATSQLSEEKVKESEALHGKLVWVIVAGTVAGGVMLALFFTGHAWAIGGAIGSGAIVGVALAVDTVTLYMPYILAGIALIGVGLLIWQLVQKKLTIQQIVKTTELAKQHMTAEARQIVFGTSDTKTHPLADVVQSPSTKSLVRKYRDLMVS